MDADATREKDARSAIDYLTKKLRQAETRLRNARSSTKKLLEIKREARRALSKCIEHKCLETPCRECSHYGMDCNSRRLLKLIDQHDRGEHLRETDETGVRPECADEEDFSAERSAETKTTETETGTAKEGRAE